MKKLALLNCAICTENGKYELKEIKNPDDLAEVVKQNGGYKNLISAIGHQATADILTKLLGTKIIINRIEFKQEINQAAIIFKLNGRIPEGKVLTMQEIEQIGYTFKLLIRTA